ncbi:hypothetical protein AA12717_3074 [Gluconacetobacter sacchari DSM 12717]|uniref:Uncharacterized protein n=1 Tax=Gluconacetobacter sacchari DSM 12717 TaxID=1307940 RepID=A0ABQ0PAJ4_9PROT|nr:hypothetical protein AA12717_3074 [Gluconacetobacter sacchari DSM 12717]
MEQGADDRPVCRVATVGRFDPGKVQRQGRIKTDHGKFLQGKLGGLKVKAAADRAIDRCGPGCCGTKR